jgi:hypothetical protein
LLGGRRGRSSADFKQLQTTLIGLQLDAPC